MSVYVYLRYKLYYILYKLMVVCVWICFCLIPEFVKYSKYHGKSITGSCFSSWFVRLLRSFFSLLDSKAYIHWHFSISSRCLKNLLPSFRTLQMTSSEQLSIFQKTNTSKITLLSFNFGQKSSTASFQKFSFRHHLCALGMVLTCWSPYPRYIITCM